MKKHLTFYSMDLEISDGFFFRGFPGDGPSISKSLGVFLKRWWRNPEDKEKVLDMASRQFIGRSPQKVVNSKGILPKIALIQVKDVYAQMVLKASVFTCEFWRVYVYYIVP